MNGRTLRAFLRAEFGEARASALLTRQRAALRALCAAEQARSPVQRAVLARVILPGIALYQVLRAEDCPEAEALSHLRRYLLDYVAAGMHASLSRLEVLPGFFALYRTGFLLAVRHAGLWESGQACGPGHFDVTIRRCLWHTACAAHGCAELCPLFCEADTVTYGGLRKLGFSRTGTLGCGSGCCDFHFYKK